ncbi:Murein DD-endopeptidase MepM and murein hydrolase activator NlpD, contain LysM domain [Thermoactinomyces sp. DSM 45891]|nr:peptidoglycan DD-metalloendopeptidase family protein [Thermoactinomyces sp. DSM 45891]SFX12695.1 Murein DD-endopeptidase MepM and murein hydrolase activator NlpD, contain LysM domain [Thermoactinomyces sp. DSM 45891]
MESSIHRRIALIKKPSWKWIIMCSLIVIPFISFVTITSVTIYSVIARLKETETAQSFGIDPALMLLYKEIADQHQLPWAFLAALDQNLPKAKAVMLPRVSKFEMEIESAAQKFSVDPALIRAIIQQESSWNPKAKSSAGARGLMQLMPVNCRAFNLDPDTTCLDPLSNVMAGTEMISRLLTKYNGNLELALAAYNAGEGNVEKHKGVPPFKETQNYVKKIPVLYKEYGGKGTLSKEEAQKKEIEELANRLKEARVKVDQAGDSDKCMKELAMHTPNRGSLTCAAYSIQSNWIFVERVENQARAYEQEVWKITSNGTEATKETGSANPSMEMSGNHTSVGMIWPCEGKVTSRFGPRWGRTHKGIDIANRKGTPIYSVLDGKVTSVKSDPGGYGHYLVIDHGKGLSSLYAHMYAGDIHVKVGDQVKKGQRIASMGSDGNSTGPHLHFEIHINGVSKDPMQYIGKEM